MSDMCARCYVPGACCKGFTLNIDPPVAKTFRSAAVTRWIRREHGLPFVCTGRNKNAMDSCSYDYKFDCIALEANGRCGIYECRPSLCVSFDAGSDPLCFHFSACECGDLSAPFVPWQFCDASGRIVDMDYRDEHHECCEYGL